MSTQMITDRAAEQMMRSCIQKVASGTAHISVVYAATIAHSHLGRHDSLAGATKVLRAALASGKAMERIQAVT